jgi:Bacterial alpha-L-rhamnosidase 6 hairpin glycosidase domain
MRKLSMTMAVLATFASAALAAEPALKITPGKGSLIATSKYLDAKISLLRPQVLRLSVDSLGRGKFRTGTLQPSSTPAGASQPTEARPTDAGVEYRGKGISTSTPARWTIDFNAKGLTLVSRWSQSDPPEPIVLEFNPKLSRATLLGTFNSDGSVRLPAILHLPGQGTVRITAIDDEKATLGYDALRTGGDYIKVSFPPATKERPHIEYRWQITTVSPQVAEIANDPRFDGFRRNWLNILQVNPRLRALSNNTASDTCALCYYEYSDVARNTPPLADGFSALDMICQTLDRILAGGKTYGMPNYLYDLPVNVQYPEPSLDTYPSLLIAAWNYAEGSDDKAWLEKNYAGVKQWADKMLAEDHNGNGLIEYHASGNSGSWAPGLPVRPANWWDTIGYGHEDAYANALAYRALRGMAALAKQCGKADDAVRYNAAADKLRNAYFKTFYNPATGVLAGWKSADGQLHDYYFLPVNGIAIHYGLVPKDKANAIMDKLLAKMKAVGYKRFDLGLPGNLIPVARKDYVDCDRRWGGGAKEDNSDGFQIYENGGATACHAFFTIAALYDLGRRDEADKILFPMLDSFEKGSFEGMGANGMSNDWKAWDGTPWGYEGFLTDGYYTMLAVLVREGRLKAIPAP